MERPQPTQKLILELCGGDVDLLSSLHHGLHETPLQGFYKYLDFNELIGFAASSWKARHKNLDEFALRLERDELYSIFTNVLDIGLRWIEKHKKLSTHSNQLYGLLNPFSGKKLKERLGCVSLESEKEFRHQASFVPFNYISEMRYLGLAEIQAERSDMIVLTSPFPLCFKNHKPSVVAGYGKTISEMLSDYPREYAHLSAVLSKPAFIKPSIKTQMELFS